MKNTRLLIMAGGASSRMKRTLDEAGLSEATKKIAQSAHKSLIPLGKSGQPLLYYLLRNAAEAGYEDIYLITSPENDNFHALVGAQNKDNTYLGLKVHFAIQQVPQGRQKPLGTADALEQTFEQYPELLTTSFTICNGDNLYSVNALTKLREDRKSPNALISYARSGLQFPDERISKFAIMDIDAEGFLKQIIEKPEPDRISKFQDAVGEIRVSMNIFSFEGASIFPYIKNCPIHPVRDEKELPEAVRNAVKDHPQSMFCIPVSEHLPDLTAAQDIGAFEFL